MPRDGATSSGKAVWKGGREVAAGTVGREHAGQEQEERAVDKRHAIPEPLTYRRLVGCWFKVLVTGDWTVGWWHDGTGAGKWAGGRWTSGRERRKGAQVQAARMKERRDETTSSSNLAQSRVERSRKRAVGKRDDRKRHGREGGDRPRER